VVQSTAEGSQEMKDSPTEEEEEEETDDSIREEISEGNIRVTSSSSKKRNIAV
jgi:hypothetical protein